MRDAHDHSYWNATAVAAEFPRLTGQITADVVVIGGGIVGVTAARMLKDSGLKVALIEARKIGRQVTGKSTAKVTSQHKLKYQTIERKFGESRARLYADAQESALRKIRDLVAQHKIDCDLETKPAFTYAREQRNVSKIKKEVEVAQRLGLPATFVSDINLPFNVAAAIRFDNQAQ
ncbi:MAG TPA: FAD-dependent oxidoreductase, partial [Xanthobacteraceae bacterium]|nr:FAD-dependent oxidoreductase [Xanthobacteraceae bacterium]